MIRKRIFKTAAVALGALLAIPAAQAQMLSPAIGSFPAGAAAQGRIVKAQYVGEGYYATPGEYYGDDDYDADEGPAVISAAPAEVEEGAYDASGLALCQDRFRSFDPATGTYTTYEGETVPCPYLR
jgi:BA14K-like protein